MDTKEKIRDGYDYIELECPSCGGHVRSDRESRKCICQYCGAELMVFFDTDKEIYKLIPYVEKEIIVKREVIVEKTADEHLKAEEEEKRRSKTNWLFFVGWGIVAIGCFLYANISESMQVQEKLQKEELERRRIEYKTEQKEEKRKNALDTITTTVFQCSTEDMAAGMGPSIRSLSIRQKRETITTGEQRKTYPIYMGDEAGAIPTYLRVDVKENETEQATGEYIFAYTDEENKERRDVAVTLENDQEFPGEDFFLLLPQLEELHIDIEGVSLHDIANNKALTRFYWENEKKAEYSANQIKTIFSDSQLEVLQLSLVNKDELCAIGDIPQLSTLIISGYTGETLAPVNQLEKLTALDITGSNGKKDQEMVGVVDFCANPAFQARLKTLRLKGMNLKNLNLKSINDFQALEIVDLSGSTIILSGLRDLSSESIKVLDISADEGNEDSFDPYMGFVEGLPNLEELYLRNTKITNLDFVEMLPNLRVIEIPEGIEDKTSLEKLPNLTHIIEGESPADLP